MKKEHDTTIDDKKRARTEPMQLAKEVLRTACLSTESGQYSIYASDIADMAEVSIEEAAGLMEPICECLLEMKEVAEAELHPESDEEECEIDLVLWTYYALSMSLDDETLTRVEQSEVILDAWYEDKAVRYTVPRSYFDKAINIADKKLWEESHETYSSKYGRPFYEAAKAAGEITYQYECLRTCA